MGSALDDIDTPTDPEQLLRNNARWAQAMQERDPWFFWRQLTAPRAQYLWIGSPQVPSPAHDMLGLRFGEVIEYRPAGGVVCSSDAYGQSLLQYAIEVLKVEHILVVGHGDCPQVGRALERRVAMAEGEHWLSHVRDVAALHTARLKAEDSLAAKRALLSQLNTIEQAIAVCSSAAVTAAWRRGQRLTVHAWLYGPSDGRLQALALRESWARSAEEIREETIAVARKAQRRLAPDPWPSPSALTRRETEVLALLAEGISNRSIAQRLHISRNTVASHLRNIYQKMGLSERVPAILAAREMQAAGSFEPLR